MADMNAGLILAGQPVNALEAIAGGQRLAAQTMALRNQNALDGVYRQHGQGILAGDQNALNALAGIDPMRAMEVQSTQQGMRMREQELANAKENARMRAMELSATLDSAALDQERAQTERVAAIATQIKDPAMWDQAMAQIDPSLVGQFAQKDMIIASVLGVAEALKMNAPPKPQSGLGKLESDYRAGLIPQPAYDAAVSKATTPSKGLTVNVGAATAESKTPTNINPFNVEDMTASIDEIMKDKALPKVLGPVEGGGGNNVDDLNLAQRLWYGSDGLSLIEKIGQLQNTTWLGARQMLKGGGAITDYESRKAEGAMARLSRVKSDSEFRAALKDLRDAVAEGARKLSAAGQTGGQVPQVDQAGLPGQTQQSGQLQSPPAAIGGDAQLQLDPETDALVRSLLAPGG